MNTKNATFPSEQSTRSLLYRGIDNALLSIADLYHVEITEETLEKIYDAFEDRYTMKNLGDVLANLTTSFHEATGLPLDEN